MLKRISAAEAFNRQANTRVKMEAMEKSADEELSFEFGDEGIGAEEEANNSSVSNANLSPTSTSSNQPPQGNLVTSEELQLEKEPIKIRETGFWRWKRILIPPNAYVVHTRLGRGAPVTIGLGKSFRYNPNTDAYLVVPAAMQTIGIVARCITQEKQGINMLAYLQWQISDFSIAYRKLDFSDSRDPLGIVNAQLGEQAEAAIKDKIATMSVEEVLTDKAPIIEELTKRIEAVTESRNHEDSVTHEGLGIKIVTVQIREAYVSSQKLWQDLQAPFRHQQEQAARISRLTMLNEIHNKELQSRHLKETREAETNAAIEQVKQSKQTEAFQLKLAEEAVRFNKEQETFRTKLQLEEQTTLAKQASQLRIQAQEQETAQHKIQLEEQTALARQTSEQRLQAQQARLAYENQLATLQQEQAKELEQAKLDNETNNKQKTLQTEQTLHAIAEESRMNEAKMQAEQLQLERETTLKKQAAALKLLTQEQDDLVEAKALEARLSRQQQENKAQLEIEEANHRVKMAQQEQEIEFLRQKQEVRNLTNEFDLLRRLIDKSAEIAAEMPDIHELKVLQTGGGNSDITFEGLSAFVAKLQAVAEHLGIPLKLASKQTPPKNKTKK
ncbi:MAG: hypothetical protein DRR08_03215 [Candidatus Parabeggiatoa sp. nov. 2]|nr:MAG: hypothetical protein DRR08_03215 [Gammaproteobacteria bacterium]